MKIFAVAIGLLATRGACFGQSDGAAAPSLYIVDRDSPHRKTACYAHDISVNFYSIIAVLHVLRIPYPLRHCGLCIRITLA